MRLTKKRCRAIAQGFACWCMLQSFESMLMCEPCLSIELKSHSPRFSGVPSLIGKSNVVLAGTSMHLAAISLSDPSTGFYMCTVPCTAPCERIKLCLFSSGGGIPEGRTTVLEHDGIATLVNQRDRECFRIMRGYRGQ